MTNTIPNVPRELLERVLNAGWGSETVNALDDLRDFLESASSSANHVEDVRAMVADPSPAGVDGLEVVAYRVSLPDEPELGTWLDEDAENEPQMCLHEPLCRLSGAVGIIDGLRGEVADLRSMLATVSKAGLRVRTERDQQAQRIGELEGLLREVAATLAWIAHGECRAIHDGPIMPSQMALDAVKAALGGSL